MVKSFEEWWNKEGLLYFGSGTEQDAREIWNAAQVAEREACAKVCEVNAQRWPDARKVYVAHECAAAIRARGQK